MADAGWDDDEQYVTDANLAARQAIYRYAEAAEPLWDWALDRAEAVVDVGCGNGQYLRALRERGHAGPISGLDLSPGMAEVTRRSSGAPAVVADARRLPLRDGASDVVLAMHMLYHVPDQAAALREMRRALRPGGRVLVTTNSVEHLRELDEAILASVRAVTGEWRPLTGTSVPYVLEGGDQVLREVFAEVLLHERRSSLVVPEADPIVAYACSMWTFDDAQPHVVGDLRRRVTEIIDREGAFRIGTATGCFVCR